MRVLLQFNLRVRSVDVRCPTEWVCIGLCVPSHHPAQLPCYEHKVQPQTLCRVFSSFIQAHIVVYGKISFYSTWGNCQLCNVPCFDAYFILVYYPYMKLDQPIIFNCWKLLILLGSLFYLMK